MPIGPRILPAIAIALALVLPAQVRAEPDARTVVATVNGTDITIGHMIVAHAGLPAQYKQLEAEVLFDALLDQLVQQTVLEQSFQGETPYHVTLSMNNQRRSLMAAEEIENILAAEVNDAAVQARYDERFSDGFGGDEFNASHILVETEEEAKAIKAEIEGGADFAETAKEKSTGPSGPRGGSLGWFGLGAMVPAFESAVVGMEPGQVSDPVQTRFGWHVIILNEKRQSEAPPLEAVRGEIVNELRQQAVQNRVEALTEAANVDRPEIEGLDPGILTNVELLGQ